jgi:hypothetical protein
MPMMQAWKVFNKVGESGMKWENRITFTTAAQDLCNAEHDTIPRRI